MKNKKTTIAIISVIALVLVIIGVTYAYWLVTKTQTNENKLTTGCLDITIDSEANDITLTNQFPLSDEDGLALTPYTFTVTNNCTTSVDYQVNLESLDSENLEEISASSIKIALFKEGTDVTTVTPALLSSYEETTTTVTDALSANKLLIDTLAGKVDGSTDNTITYNLLLWIDADAPISEQSKGFTSKISVTVGQGIENATYEPGTLAYQIIASNGGEGNIKSVTDFSTAPTAGLYKALDNDGMSYYFSGDVKNNYVKFVSEGLYCPNNDCDAYGSYQTLDECAAVYGDAEACVKTSAGDPMYWRIVRINGDGTIKIIYDGTEAYENGVNHSASYNPDPTYWEIYWYNTLEESEQQILDGFGQDSYGVNWHNEQFYNSSYHFTEYFTSVKNCMDFTLLKTESADSSIKNYYTPSDRYSNKQPLLTCNEDYIRNRETINFLTMDEVMMAGSYLQIGEEFWTSSPASITKYSGDNEYVSAAMYTSSLRAVSYDDSSIVIRPVYNLKEKIGFEGAGTKDNPYIFR